MLTQNLLVCKVTADLNNKTNFDLSKKVFDNEILVDECN